MPLYFENQKSALPSTPSATALAPVPPPTTHKIREKCRPRIANLPPRPVRVLVHKQLAAGPELAHNERTMTMIIEIAFLDQATPVVCFEINAALGLVPRIVRLTMFGTKYLRFRRAVHGEPEPAASAVHV